MPPQRTTRASARLAGLSIASEAAVDMGDPRAALNVIAKAAKEIIETAQNIRPDVDELLRSKDENEQLRKTVKRLEAQLAAKRTIETKLKAQLVAAGETIAKLKAEEAARRAEQANSVQTKSIAELTAMAELMTDAAEAMKGKIASLKPKPPATQSHPSPQSATSTAAATKAIEVVCVDSDSDDL